MDVKSTLIVLNLGEEGNQEGGGWRSGGYGDVEGVFDRGDVFDESLA